MAICLTADKAGHHAYFPALMTSIGFADFLSGLYAGTLDRHGLIRRRRRWRWPNSMKFASAASATSNRLLLLLVLNKFEPKPAFM